MDGYNISFRFTADLFPIETFDNFLKETGIVIRKSSMGHHTEECATPHIHYHLWCENTFKFKSPPTQTFKNKHKSLEKVFKENTNSLSVKVSKVKVPPSFEDVGEIYDGEINDVKRFLNYPLKEKKPIEQFCRGIDIASSCLEGNAEWQSVLVYRKKLKARKLAEETKKGMLYDHLDKQHPSCLYDCVRETLLFYKGNKDAPHPQYQVKSAEIYAYHKGIWSIEDILNRYLPRSQEYKEDKKLFTNLESLGLYAEANLLKEKKGLKE